MTRSIPTLTLDDARGLIAAGEAKEIGVPYNTAVADAGGSLIAHVRMDGAWLGSIDISIGKAFSARAFDMRRCPVHRSPASRCSASTPPMAERSSCSAAACRSSLGTSSSVALVASGGSVAQDIVVAEAAAAAFKG